MPFFSKKKTEERTVIVSVREGLERITVEIHGRNRRGVWATVATAAADYAEQEYRLTKAELAKAAEKIHEEIDAAETIEFTGDLQAAFASASLADQALSQPRGKAGARRNRGGKRRIASAA